MTETHQKLITEIFKVKVNLAPEIIKEVFEIVEGLTPSEMNLN